MNDAKKYLIIPKSYISDFLHQQEFLKIHKKQSQQRSIRNTTTLKEFLFPPPLCPINQQFARTHYIHVEDHVQTPTQPPIRTRFIRTMHLRRSPPLFLKAAPASLTNRKLRTIIDNLSLSSLIFSSRRTFISLPRLTSPFSTVQTMTTASDTRSCYSTVHCRGRTIKNVFRDRVTKPKADRETRKRERNKIEWKRNSRRRE